MGSQPPLQGNAQFTLQDKQLVLQSPEFAQYSPEVQAQIIAEMEPGFNYQPQTVDMNVGQYARYIQQQANPGLLQGAIDWAQSPQGQAVQNFGASALGSVALPAAEALKGASLGYLDYTQPAAQLYESGTPGILQNPAVQFGRTAFNVGGTVAPFATGQALLEGGLMAAAKPFGANAVSRVAGVANALPATSGLVSGLGQAGSFLGQLGRSSALGFGIGVAEQVPGPNKFDPLGRISKGITNAITYPIGDAAFRGLAAGAAKTGIPQAISAQTAKLAQPVIEAATPAVKAFQKTVIEPAATVLKGEVSQVGEALAPLVRKALEPVTRANLRGQLTVNTQAMKALLAEAEKQKLPLDAARIQQVNQTIDKLTKFINSKQVNSIALNRLKKAQKTTYELVQELAGKPKPVAPTVAQAPNMGQLAQQAQAIPTQAPQQLQGNVVVDDVSQFIQQEAQRVGLSTLDELKALVATEGNKGASRLKEAGVDENIRKVLKGGVNEAGEALQTLDEKLLPLEQVSSVLKGKAKTLAGKVDQAIREGKKLRVEYAAEEIGRSNKAATLTKAGNVKTAATELSPIGFGKVSKPVLKGSNTVWEAPINPKTGSPYKSGVKYDAALEDAIKKGEAEVKDYVTVKGYSGEANNHIRTYYLTESPKGSVLEKATVLDKPAFEGEYANVYSGPKPVDLKAIAERGPDPVGNAVKTSEAKESLLAIGDIFSPEIQKALPANIRKQINGIKKAGRVDPVRLQQLIGTLKKDSEALKAVCKLFNL